MADLLNQLEAQRQGFRGAGAAAVEPQSPLEETTPTPVEQVSFAPGVSLPQFHATKPPASAMHTPAAEGDRQGFWNALIYGAKEDREQTTRSMVGSTLTDFVRSGVDAGFELFDEDRKAVRQQIEEIRKYDPNTADEIERGIGERKSTAQNITRLGASIVEAGLAVVPAAAMARGLQAAFKVQQVARVGSAVARGGSLATRTIARIPGVDDVFAKNILTGFKYGSGFAGLDSLAREADFAEALKDAAVGGAFGVAFPLGGRVASKTFQGLRAATGATSRVAQRVFPQFSRGGTFFQRNPSSQRLFRNLFPVGSTMKRYYGEVGDTFVNLYEKGSALAEMEISDFGRQMMERGLLNPPPITRRLYKNVESLVDNKDLMLEANRALRGLGMYENPSVRQAFLADNPAIKFIDDTFKRFGERGQQEGFVDELLENYVTKSTPPVTLKNKMRRQVDAATTRAQREQAYADNDELVRDMVENAVFSEKAFSTLDEAYRAYYDWADFVAEGGRTGVNNNAFLQWMVRTGKAGSIEEAAGKLTRSMQHRNPKNLSKKSSSLDYAREIDMPFYDPNPARVLAAYGSEVISRFSMSSVFGRNDEVLNKLIGTITNEKSPALGEAFTELVERALKGSKSTTAAEDLSAWARGLQIFKMSFASIFQIGQNLNTVLSSDWKSFGYGLKKSFSDEGVRTAIESGALMNSFIREMHAQQSGGTRIADKFLRGIGMTQLDLFNRVVAANAGELYAQRQLTSLLKRIGKEGAEGVPGFRTQALPEALRLREIGVDVDNAIKNGVLSKEDLLNAGYTIAKESQFLGRPIDLPYFASSATGKVIMQFRTFAYQQGTFLKRQIYDDLAGKGDFKRGMKNLLVFATVFPMTGEVLADIRSLATNSKRPAFDQEFLGVPYLARYIDNLLSAGGFGLAYDALQSANKGRIREFIEGAAIGEVFDLVENVGSGDVKALTKQGINFLPFGRAVSNRIWPSQQDGETIVETLQRAADE